MKKFYTQPDLELVKFNLVANSLGPSQDEDDIVPGGEDFTDPFGDEGL